MGAPKKAVENYKPLNRSASDYWRPADEFSA
jgi:hypothetical protein